jgi:hypothetical protein
MDSPHRRHMRRTYSSIEGIHHDVAGGYLPQDFVRADYYFRLWLEEGTIKLIFFLTILSG